MPSAALAAEGPAAAPPAEAAADETPAEEPESPAQPEIPANQPADEGGEAVNGLEAQAEPLFAAAEPFTEGLEVTDQSSAEVKVTSYEVSTLTWVQADSAGMNGRLGLVTPEYINSALVANVPIAYTWQFDWNLDNTYVQNVILKIDPKKVVLMKNGAQQHLIVQIGSDGYPSLESAIAAGAAVTAANNAFTTTTETNADGAEEVVKTSLPAVRG